MIKIVDAKYLENFRIHLLFSDGEQGIFNLSIYLNTHEGPLLTPLRDENYARRCFVNAGALCWTNGLELSPERLHGICLVTGAA